MLKQGDAKVPETRLRSSCPWLAVGRHWGGVPTTVSGRSVCDMKVKPSTDTAVLHPALQCNKQFGGLDIKGITAWHGLPCGQVCMLLNGSAHVEL